MYRFLIADEETLFCSGLDFLLRDLFLRSTVLKCSDMNSLSTVLADSEKIFDVFIIDLKLARLGNYENLKRLSTAITNTPLIVMGNDDRTDCIRACMNSGANGYILKKSTTKTLKLAINLIMNGEIYVPSSPFIEKVADVSTSPLKLYGIDNPLGGLTRRQFEVLALIMDGQPNKQIALNLGLLENTVKSHVKAVLRKLNANNRTQAAKIAIALGLPSNIDPV